MKEMEHIDVRSLSREALGQYLDIWQDVVNDLDGYAFMEWLCQRNERQPLNFDKLTLAERERLVEEARPEWATASESTKAQMHRLSLKRPPVKS
jgi:hypothetical protein